MSSQTVRIVDIINYSYDLYYYNNDLFAMFSLNTTLNYVYNLGLGDAWGAATPANHAKEACIKELGSYLLQVNILKVIG